jgi:hypothetical protein
VHRRRPASPDAHACAHERTHPRTQPSTHTHTHAHISDWVWLLVCGRACPRSHANRTRSEARMCVILARRVFAPRFQVGRCTSTFSSRCRFYADMCEYSPRCVITLFRSTTLLLCSYPSLSTPASLVSRVLPSGRYRFWHPELKQVCAGSVIVSNQSVPSLHILLDASPRPTLPLSTACGRLRWRCGMQTCIRHRARLLTRFAHGACATLPHCTSPY